MEEPEVDQPLDRAGRGVGWVEIAEEQIDLLVAIDEQQGASQRSGRDRLLELAIVVELALEAQAVDLEHIGAADRFAHELEADPKQRAPISDHELVLLPGRDRGLAAGALGDDELVAGAEQVRVGSSLAQRLVVGVIPDLAPREPMARGDRVDAVVALDGVAGHALRLSRRLVARDRGEPSHRPQGLRPRGLESGRESARSRPGAGRAANSAA